MSQMATDTKRSSQNSVINPQSREEHDTMDAGTSSAEENTRTDFNIVDGHTFPIAGFVEIDPKSKDDVLTGHPEITAMTLLRLTRRNGPWRKYQGLEWQDLFAEKTRYDKMRWVRMTAILFLASNTDMNEDCMFRLWFCLPGLVHIELDDEGSWTVQDILALPKWMFIG